MSSSRSCLAIIALAITAPVVASAQECPVVVWMDSFETAKGKTLILPDIGTLTCDEMEVTLSRIDSTHYRENAPLPADTADMPLFCYEGRLATVHYEDCILKRRSGANAGETLHKKVEKK